MITWINPEKYEELNFNSGCSHNKCGSSNNISV
jgi:succinate dehydrogenase/fumarate reductase-like Fe-S protein